METQSTFSIKRWILATLGGWILGVALILMLSGMLEGAGIHHMQFYLGLGMGTGVGLAQWFFFRKQLSLSLFWLWSTAFGMGLPFLILDLFPDGSIPHKIAISIALGALVTGWLQSYWIKKRFDGAALWLPYCMVGWLLAVGTVFIIDYTWALRGSGLMNLWLALLNLALILAGGPVLGWITGMAWKRMKSKSAAE